MKLRFIPDQPAHALSRARLHPLVSFARPVPDVLHQHGDARLRSWASRWAAWRRGASANLLAWTPLLLVIGLGSAHLVEWQRRSWNSIIDVGNQVSPQMVFFGVESQPWDLSKFVVPIEACRGVLLRPRRADAGRPRTAAGPLAVAAARTASRPTPINIVGSIAGILLFTACSLVGARAGLVVRRACWSRSRTSWCPVASRPQRVLVAGGGRDPAARVSDVGAGPGHRDTREFWSPYYRIHYGKDAELHHRQPDRPPADELARRAPFPAYALPHLLNRDAGGQPFAQVLVIGAGSGNDVSRALAVGRQARRCGGDRSGDLSARTSAIIRISRTPIPARIVHLDDGRNYPAVDATSSTT